MVTKTAFFQILIPFLSAAYLLGQRPPEFLYVGGVGTAGYSIDSTTGALTALPGSPFQVGGNGIAFSPTGQFAYFSGTNPSGISVAAISPAGGLQVIPGSPFQPELTAYAIAVVPSGHYAYVAAGNNFGPLSIYPFTIDGLAGALTPAGPPVGVVTLPALPDGLTMRVHPSGKFLFVASPLGSGFLEFSIDPKTGGLAQIGQIALYCSSLALSPDGYVYVSSDEGIAAYSLDLNTGALTAVAGSPFPTPGGLNPIVVDRTGRFFYNVGEPPLTSLEILGSLLNPDNGGLESPLIGSPYMLVGSGPISALAVDHTNRFLYAAEPTFSGTTFGFAIKKISGALTQVPGSPFAGADNPVYIGVAPTLNPGTATLVSLSIRPSNPQVNLNLGAVQQFTAAGKYSDGTSQYLTASAAWESSNEGVATISNVPGSQGLATLLVAGQTTITATLGSLSAHTVLTAVALHLVSIAVSPINPAIVAGTAIPFMGTGTFSDGSTQNLTDAATWLSSNVNVAPVNRIGEAYGKAAGTAIISASSGVVTGSSTLIVNQ